MSYSSILSVMAGLGSLLIALGAIFTGVAASRINKLRRVRLAQVIAVRDVVLKQEIFDRLTPLVTDVEALHHAIAEIFANADASMSKLIPALVGEREAAHIVDLLARNPEMV